MELKFNIKIFDEVFSKNDYYLLRQLLPRALSEVTEFQPLREKPYRKRQSVKELHQIVQVVGHFNVQDTQFKLQDYQVYEMFLKTWIKYLIEIKKYVKSGTKEFENVTYENLPWITIQTEKAFPFAVSASHERQPATSIKFGTLLSCSHFVSHVQLQSDQSIDAKNYREFLEASFFHDTKEIELIIDKRYSMRFHYSVIRHLIVELSPKESKITLYIVLINPPSVSECEETISVKPKFGSIQFKNPPLYYTRTVATIPGVTEDELGRSNTIAISFLKGHVATQIISRLFFRIGKKPIAYAIMEQTHIDSPKGFPKIQLDHFGCTYLLSAIIRRRFIIQLENPGLKMNEFNDKLRDLTKQNSKCMNMALEETLQYLDEGVIANYSQLILDIYESLVNNFSRNSKDYSLLPQNTKKIWRVVITPLRLLLFPAEEVFGNRVIRNFSCEHALRVSFRNDNFKRLSGVSSRCSEDYINSIILYPMEEGLTIGDRHFKFLGWSSSQLRDHGVYMYAKDNDGHTAVSIRAWMGDFAGIKNVPKYMARMGQCFSHTEPTVSVPLHSSRVVTVSDVEGGLNPANGKPYCFSDGVGRISEKLMKEVTERMEFDYIPSAVQFRYAGYKGMLSLDPTLKGCDIVFRKSQLKFPCEGSDKLEIVSKSTATALQLNKQLITILDQKKVPVEVFLEIQQTMLRELTAMLFENNKAAQYLSTHSAMPGINFKSLARAGFGLNRESFFRNILLAQHRVALEGIKEKARLDIEHDLGRNMFGIMDETGILEYGQVFVQYTTQIGENSNKLYKTIRIGKVMVTKNPCLQLGDVRIFEAINVPELSHIVDCIVFPSKGPRPHPSEMAGSDLDGDEYSIIWKEELFFDGPNDEASVFPVPNQEIQDGNITVRHMIEFLTKYIMNDRLGVIANAHLARADDQEVGLNHPLCKSIAKKFSIAVDFAKNGQEVKLSADERPEKYPDFMEKGSHANSYKSTRILGKLYRICKEYEEANKISSESNLKVEIDEDLIVPGWEKFKLSAISAGQNYKRALGSVLTHYGVQSDYEACGKALTKIHSRLERQERLDVEEILTKSIHHIWKVLGKEFMEEFEPKLKSTNPDLLAKDPIYEDILKKASAWYVTAYSNSKDYYPSFAWICWKHLLAIKKRKVKEVPIPYNPYVEKLDDILQLALQTNPLNPLSVELKQLCKNHLATKNGQTSLQLWQLELALQILIHWGENQEVIKLDSEKQIPDEKKVSAKYFARIFFQSVKNYKRKLTITELLLDFFGLCVCLRFILNPESEEEKKKVKKHRFLGKKAMATYHSLAVGPNLRCLGLTRDEAPYELIEVTEMDPIRVKSISVATYSSDGYAPLKRLLTNESGVTSVNVRQIKQHLLISATGSKLSQQFLKKALSKLTTTSKNTN